MLREVADKASAYGNRGQIMIIDYDRNPALTVDQKLQSLIDSMQRTVDELTISIEMLRREVKKIQESE